MKSENKKKILIAHQSTIPHYRVAFYESVMKQKPEWWNFTVIYDSEETLKQFYLSPESSRFSFSVKNTKSYKFHLMNRKLIYQSFPFTSLDYDLLIVGNAMNNISYPLSFFRLFLKKKVAYWGHGKDFFTVEKGIIKKSTENLKTFLSRKTAGFFAYTPGVKRYLIQQGVPADKIHTLYNTIDTDGQRKKYLELKGKRESIRENLKLKDKKVLLYVGRFNKEKRIEFLLKSFEILFQNDPSFTLLLIGGGNTEIISEFNKRLNNDAIKYIGVVEEDNIAQYYVASDLFVYPGAVGLGPIQAMCYDLLPVVIDSDIHSPEFEYLSDKNALILPKHTDEISFANAIVNLMEKKEELLKLRKQIWESIYHLTIDRMAQNFINGVNSILKEN